MMTTSRSDADPAAAESDHPAPESLLDTLAELANGDALPESWPVLASRVVVQTLASAMLQLECGTIDANGAKVRETLATALYRTLPDGIRTELPADDQEARILARYTPAQDEG
jgi:hypothetical protein